MNNCPELRASRRIFAFVLLVAGSLIAASSARGQIVYDTFGTTGGIALAPNKPGGANLPGGTYASFSFYGAKTSSTSTAAGNPVASATTGASTVTSIPISSSGTYVEPSTLGISADLSTGNIGNDSSVGRGVGLGFDSNSGNSPPTNSGNGFYGIYLDPNGNLVMDTSGSFALLGGSSNYNSAALGAFSTSNFYNLSYLVNTLTGTVSNITLSDSTGSATFPTQTTAFSGLTAYNYAAFESDAPAVTNAGVYETGYVDNFTVVPEPASLAFFATAGLALMTRCRRRKA